MAECNVKWSLVSNPLRINVLINWSRTQLLATCSLLFCTSVLAHKPYGKALNSPVDKIIRSHCQHKMSNNVHYLRQRETAKTWSKSVACEERQAPSRLKAIFRLIFGL